MSDWFDLRQRTAWNLLGVFAVLSGGLTYLTVGYLAKGAIILNFALFGILTLPLLFAVLLALALCGAWVLIAVLLFLQRPVGFWSLSIFCTLKSIAYALILWIVMGLAQGLRPDSQAVLAQRFPHYRDMQFWLGCVAVVYGSVAIALWRVLLTRRLPQA